jgi:hypothetical protein
MPVQPGREGCTNDLLLAMSGYVVASRSRRAAGSSSPRSAGNRAFDLEFGQTTKWDGDRLIIISAFWDANLQAKQLGLTYFGLTPEECRPSPHDPQPAGRPARPHQPTPRRQQPQQRPNGDIIMILITTAGKVGSEAARQLAQRGEPVRVLVRSPDKAAALARNGIDVFQGDLEIPASLDSAMRGVTHVVLVTQPVVKQELNVIDSAARAGVEHVVKITSKASADSPIARRRNQAQIEHALIASALQWDRLTMSPIRPDGQPACRQTTRSSTARAKTSCPRISRLLGGVSERRVG